MVSRNPIRRETSRHGLSLSVLLLLLLATFGYAGSTNTHHRHTRHSPGHGHDHSKIQNRATSNGDKYLIGVGKADITGPVVEIGLGGYADLAQTGQGLRQRIYSRAFIVGDVKNPKDRFVYLVLDIQSGDTAVRYGVLESLARMGSEYSVYDQQRIAVTGTHSHSGPGAWFNYLLPQVTTYGFNKQSYQAIVDGAVLSIKRAHENLQEVWEILLSLMHRNSLFYRAT
jgi:neutral ceramidase